MRKICFTKSFLLAISFIVLCGGLLVISPVKASNTIEIDYQANNGIGIYYYAFSHDGKRAGQTFTANGTTIVEILGTGTNYYNGSSNQHLYVCEVASLSSTDCIGTTYQSTNYMVAGDGSNSRFDFFFTGIPTQNTHYYEMWYAMDTPPTGDYNMMFYGGTSPGYSYGQFIDNAGYDWDSFTIYSGPSMWCGDNTCNNSETCSSCPADCGFCNNLSITSPVGNATIRGSSVVVEGNCVSVSGAWINQLMVGTGSFLPVQDGNCDCAGNHFKCAFTAPSYGSYPVTVVDLTNYYNTDTRTFDFTSYTNPQWLNYYYYIYNKTGSTSTPATSLINYYKDEGYIQSSAPLYFTFSTSTVASSSNFHFDLMDITDPNSVDTMASGTLDTLGLNGNNQLAYTMSMTSVATHTILSVLTTIESGVVQSDMITAVWNDSNRYVTEPVTDFTTYFPATRRTLNDKILFHQFFIVYDLLVQHFGNFNSNIQPFAVTMRTISANGQYNVISPVLDFSIPAVKQFSVPLRSYGSDLIYLLFGVWLILRITKIKW